MKILRFSRFWFLLFLFPTASYADFSQEEVIDEFIRIQKEGSLSTPNKNPAYNTKYYLPLNKVIPVEMQKRLRERRNNKRPLSFGNVSRSVDLRYRDTPPLLLKLGQGVLPMALSRVWKIY